MKFAKQIEEIGAGAVIISHLPFLSLLVSLLVADDGDQPVVSFKPGSAVCMEKDEAGRWSTTLVVRPIVIATSAHAHGQDIKHDVDLL
ncbi:MAG: hypothetical protein ACREUD_01825 [Gammaproteobacteria bacterium]